MMTFKNGILVLLISALLFKVQAQTKQLDSVNKLIDNAKTETALIDLLLKKGELFVSINIDSSIAVYNQALKKANRANYHKGKFESLKYLSSNYAKKSDSINAEDNLTQLKQLVKSSKDSVEIAEMYGSYGSVNAIQGRYDEAIPLLLKAIRIIEKKGHSPALSTYYNELGVSYWTKGNFPQALKFQQAGLKLAEKKKDFRRQAVLLVNIAGVQMDMLDFLRAEQSYNKTIAIAKQNNFTDVQVYAYSNLSSLAMLKKDYKNAYNFAIKAADLGSTLGNQVIQAANFSKAAKGLAEMSRFAEAKKYAQQAIDLANIVDQQFISSQAYSSMATTFRLQKKHKEAIPYFEKALSDVNLKDFNELTSSLFNELSECYEQTGDSKKALAAFKNYEMMKDSIRNRENIQKATEQNMNFEFDKKQAIAKVAQDQKDLEAKRARNRQLFIIAILGILGLAILIIALILFKNNKQKQLANAHLERQKQKAVSALSKLKSTQKQLIQSEKMASLGELTAGIAHEIQNPLNFVNNFSEVSKELLDELKDELDKGNADDAKEIADNVIQNLEKINHHGKRADNIVKGMLQHSRTSTGTKELTNINALTDEYLRLAYHGLRAKDKSFNATLETDYDATIGTINIIPQDIGRVILNLITNAFYALNDKKKSLINGSNVIKYEPTLWVSTKKKNNNIFISVKDNGNGIPQKILDKIFQPFFTTKPTGEGTGLGLSLSYDIIKAHGGTLKVETKEEEGSEFIIELLINDKS